MAVNRQGPGRAVGLCPAGPEEPAMDRPPQVSAEALMEELREKFEHLCRGVADAVNDAPPGQVINASEEKVRGLLAGFRQTTYQTAVQLRLQAQEAASPPPTHPETGKRLQNKGPEPFSVLTINGRIVLTRRRYFAKDLGGFTPLDPWIDRAEATITLGVREMACRLNLASRNFDKAAENLQRAAQFSLSGELLRQVVEGEGQAVQTAAQAGLLPLDWDASDCPAHDKDGKKTGKTRLYLGSDGVKVPLVTQAEKDARRAQVKAKRRRCGKKCRPLPRARAGADQRYKEFKIVTYYDDTQDHRLVSVTRGDHEVAGRLMRRDGGRVALDRADDKVAVVDGADWIKNQMTKQSLPLDDIGLDFYHLADYAHKTKRAVYGEEGPEDKTAPGQVWVAGILHTAKHQGYQALRDALVAWKATLCGPKQQQAAEALIGYVT